MSKRKPCYQCQRRKLGCHSQCPDYARETAENEERRRKLARERAITSGHADSARRIRDRSAVKYRED